MLLLIQSAQISFHYGQTAQVNESVEKILREKNKTNSDSIERKHNDKPYMQRLIGLLEMSYLQMICYYNYTNQ